MALGGMRYPLMEQHRRMGIGIDGKKMAVSLSVKRAAIRSSTRIRIPRIHAIWLEEMRQHGITPRMDDPHQEVTRC